MLGMNLTKNAAAERRELLILALGLPVVAAVLYWLTAARNAPLILVALAVIALVGYLFYKAVGRDVYLVFAVVAAGIGKLVSAIVVIVMYVVTIGMFGSLLKLFGMNRLDRNFELCKRRESMLVEAQSTDIENFRRQS